MAGERARRREGSRWHMTAGEAVIVVAIVVAMFFLAEPHHQWRPRPAPGGRCREAQPALRRALEEFQGSGETFDDEVPPELQYELAGRGLLPGVHREDGEACGYAVARRDPLRVRCLRHGDGLPVEKLSDALLGGRLARKLEDQGLPARVVAAVRTLERLHAEGTARTRFATKTRAAGWVLVLLGLAVAFGLTSEGWGRGRWAPPPQVALLGALALGLGIALWVTPAPGRADLDLGASTRESWLAQAREVCWEDLESGNLRQALIQAGVDETRLWFLEELRARLAPGAYRGRREAQRRASWATLVLVLLAYAAWSLLGRPGAGDPPG